MRAKKQINIEIGEQIKLAREQAKLTQEQLAERIDVSPQFVSDLERGVVGISLATLKRACVALGVSSDQILFGSSAKGPADTIGLKCSSLSQRQLSLLSNIIDNFLAAVAPDDSHA